LFGLYIFNIFFFFCSCFSFTFILSAICYSCNRSKLVAAPRILIFTIYRFIEKEQFLNVVVFAPITYNFCFAFDVCVLLSVAAAASSC